MTLDLSVVLAKSITSMGYSSHSSYNFKTAIYWSSLLVTSNLFQGMFYTRPNFYSMVAWSWQGLWLNFLFLCRTRKILSYHHSGGYTTTSVEKRKLIDRTLCIFHFQALFKSIHINVRLWFGNRNRSKNKKIIEIQLSSIPQSCYFISAAGVGWVCVVSRCSQKNFVHHETFLLKSEHSAEVISSYWAKQKQKLQCLKNWITFSNQNMAFLTWSFVFLLCNHNKTTIKIKSNSRQTSKNKFFSKKATYPLFPPPWIVSFLFEIKLDFRGSLISRITQEAVGRAVGGSRQAKDNLGHA